MVPEQLKIQLKLIQYRMSYTHPFYISSGDLLFTSDKKCQFIENCSLEKMIYIYQDTNQSIRPLKMHAK